MGGHQWSRPCQHSLRSGIQTASLGVSEVPRVSPRAECRDVQCLPCVCVVLVTRTGSMGLHPYSKEARVPRQPRGFPGVRVDCCWMTFLPFSGMFLSVLVAARGVHEPSGHFIVIIISASTAHATAHATPHALTGMASHLGV